MFNKLDEVKYSDGRGEYAEIVGGGTNKDDRRNIYTLDWDGNGWFAGGVYVGEDNGRNKKLATVDQIPTTAAAVGAAPAGLVYTTLNIASGTDADLMAAIDGIYAQMEDKTVRFVVASIDIAKEHPVLGYGNWLIRIYRSNEEEGHIDCGSAVNYEFKRHLKAGLWGNWLWVNPPMMPGVEYRTAELHNGKPVYMKLINCGAGPNASEKKVYHYVNKGAFIDFGGYCYNTGVGNASLSIPWFDHLKITAISESQIVINCPTADYRSFNVMVWLKYYKLTD